MAGRDAVAETLFLRVGAERKTAGLSSWNDSSGFSSNAFLVFLYSCLGSFGTYSGTT